MYMCNTCVCMYTGGVRGVAAELRAADVLAVLRC